ncbi:MAG: hypothetical protein ACFCVD_15485 [Nodosilinea sp.]
MFRLNADPAFLALSGPRLARLKPWPQGIVTLLSGLLLALPGQAHEVDVAADVGGTLHIEPNDTPKAQEQSQIWIALTREGGEVIPLSACDCALTIAADLASATPLAQPPLQPVSAEGYENIPGANVTFPAVGTYIVTLTGAPNGTVDFTPFELIFPVTVAAAAALAPPAPAADSAGASADIAVTAPDSTTHPNPKPNSTGRILALAGLGLGAGALVWAWPKKGKPKAR